MLKIKWDRVKSRIDLDKFVMATVEKRNAYLGGGCFRGVFGKDEVIADYDVFFKGEIDAANMRLDLEEAGFETVFQCPLGKLTTMKKDGIKVQLITEFYYPTPQSLVETFDLDACFFVLYNNILYTSRRAIRAVRRKHITFNSVDFPVATFKRIMKYMQKGYTIPNESIDTYVQLIYNKGRIGEELNTRVYID